MPLKYYVSDPQVQEWDDRMQEIPEDWEPNEEQTEGLRLARAQVLHWRNNGGRVLTDEEVELVCTTLALKPASAYRLDRYDHPARDAAGERRRRMRPMHPRYSA